MRSDRLFHLTKRLVDIVISLFFLVFFSPVFILTALAIIIDDFGNPIYTQTRVGKNRRKFRFYKFRSMVKNADEILFSNPDMYKQARSGAHKIKNDPRITRVGKFIRKYSIDEFPQFVNVLKGEMSFVGPRAFRPDELEKFEKEHPEAQKYIKYVFGVKPGITGLWQVSGRSKISFVERVKLDASYAKKKSILRDMLIILKTPFVVLRGEGAE